MYLRNHPETRLEDLVIYTTSQTHSLGAKAGLVLGLSTRALDVSSDDNFGLRGKTLQLALEEDEHAGRKPFILSWSSLSCVLCFILIFRPTVATVGTTSSGAVDYLPEIEAVGMS
jgi:aromatic-L-amino-acid decarboxylase